MSSSAEAALERKAAQMVVPLPQVEQDPLPCPRCSSNNTKFCYYNNYNFSQPRHFCKSCRRYWTHGGTLRDVPVGGGSRKSAKRSRTSASISPCSAAAVTSTASSNCGGGGGGGSMGSNFDALPTGPLFTSAAGGGFTSLLSLGGLGLGLELEDVGFEMGRSGGGVWAFPEVGFVNDATGGGNGGGNGHVADGDWS